MPINSRDKRASAIGAGLAFRTVLPNPDPQAEDQGDRQQMDYLYRGILAALPFTIKGAISAIVESSRTSATVTDSTFSADVGIIRIGVDL